MSEFIIDQLGERVMPFAESISIAWRRSNFCSFVLSFGGGKYKLDGMIGNNL